MKYRNNLTDSMNNSFFKVTSPFKIYIAVGRYTTNTFFGSARAMGVMYRHVTLNPGDEIHDLVGGVFVYHDGKTYQGKMNLSEKHPFEKVYGREEEIFPVENLTLISSPSSNDWNSNLPEVNAPRRYYGRSIDSVEGI